MTQSSDLNWQRDDFANITEPFENDLLNRKPLAEHLTRYIDRLQVGAVLALDARWGEGKTWFVQHWKAHLEQPDNHHNVIYLNAFSQDYLEDPFMVLSAEITHAFDNAQDNHPLIQNFKETAITAAKALLPELPKLMLSLGVTLMGAGYFGKALESAVGHVKDAVDSAKDMYDKNTFSDIRETIDANIQDAIKSRFEKHEADKQTLESFKQALRELAADVTLNPKPLVFIIDELDRCNPLFSVRLIERIKHFFDIPNIVFVLVTDKKQLQSTICHEFGYNSETSKRYLEKFIDVTIKLSPDLISKDVYLHFVTETLNAMNFSQDAIPVLKIDIVIYALAMKLSIREIKNKLHRFALYYFDSNTDKCRILLFKIFCSEYPTFKIPHDIVKMHQIALYRLLDPIIRSVNSVGLQLPSDSLINPDNASLKSENLDDYLHRPLEATNLMTTHQQELNNLKFHFKVQFQPNDDDAFKWTTLHHMLNIIEKEAESPDLNYITDAIQALVPYPQDIGDNHHLYEKMNLSWEKFLATGLYE